MGWSKTHSPSKRAVGKAGRARRWRSMKRRTHFSDIMPALPVSLEFCAFVSCASMASPSQRPSRHNATTRSGNLKSDMMNPARNARQANYCWPHAWVTLRVQACRDMNSWAALRGSRNGRRICALICDFVITHTISPAPRRFAPMAQPRFCTVSENGCPNAERAGAAICASRR